MQPGRGGASSVCSDMAAEEAEAPGLPEDEDNTRVVNHKSRVKGYLRLEMTYLPKSNGSEDDNADQVEELEPGWVVLNQPDAASHLQRPPKPSPLPPGREERQDILGRTYYESRRTQWKRPSPEEDLSDAENGNIQLQAQRAFTTRRQISEEVDSADVRKSPENWEIIRDDENAVYSSQAFQSPLSGHVDSQAHLAEELCCCVWKSSHWPASHKLKSFQPERQLASLYL
ncbi:E3 ubiquitin-protein ligase NEDD4 [Lemmus lemmus]